MIIFFFVVIVGVVVELCMATKEERKVEGWLARRRRRDVPQHLVGTLLYNRYFNVLGFISI